MAVAIASRGSVDRPPPHLQRHIVVSGAKKLSVLRAKAITGPKEATMMPPTAGPTLRTVLYPTESSVTAAGRSLLSTMSPSAACQAGLLMAAPQPTRKLKPSTIQGVARPSAMRVVSDAEE